MGRGNTEPLALNDLEGKYTKSAFFINRGMMRIHGMETVITMLIDRLEATETVVQMLLKHSTISDPTALQSAFEAPSGDELVFVLLMFVFVHIVS